MLFIESDRRFRTPSAALVSLWPSITTGSTVANAVSGLALDQTIELTSSPDLTYQFAPVRTFVADVLFNTDHDLGHEASCSVDSIACISVDKRDPFTLLAMTRCSRCCVMRINVAIRMPTLLVRTTDLA